MRGKTLNYNLGRLSVAALTILSLSSLVIAQNSALFDDAFRAMKRDEKLQFELPPQPDPPKIGWLENLLEGIADFIEAISPLLKILFYLGIGVIIALILFAIAKVIFETRFQREAKESEEEAPPPLYVPDQDQARILLEDVDAMAAEGRYQDAVHELLFRSIQDIDIRRPNTIRRSLTSREIAALKILTPATREAFATIGGVVETSYFGGQKIGKAEFDICRAAYAQFAQKSAWKQAA
jgi:hypothetical protein